MKLGELVIEATTLSTKAEKLLFAARLIEENSDLQFRNRFTCDACGAQEDHPIHMVRLLRAEAAGEYPDIETKNGDPSP